MRILVFFDIPQKEDLDKKIYRDFVKFLDRNGYVRIQYSIFSKLCIHATVAYNASKKLKENSPINADIKYMIISEKQYISMVNVNSNYTLNEKVQTTNRMLIIGGIDESSECN